MNSSSDPNLQHLYVDYIKHHVSALTFKVKWRKRCPESLKEWPLSSGISRHGWYDEVSKTMVKPSHWWIIECPHAECKPPTVDPDEVLVDMSWTAQLERVVSTLTRLERLSSPLIQNLSKQISKCREEKHLLESRIGAVPSPFNITRRHQMEMDDDLERTLPCLREVEELCISVLQDLEIVWKTEHDYPSPDIQTALRFFWKGDPYLDMWSKSVGRSIPW